MEELTKTDSLQVEKAVEKKEELMQQDYNWGIKLSSIPLRIND